MPNRADSSCSAYMGLGLAQLLHHALELHRVDVVTAVFVKLRGEREEKGEGEGRRKTRSKQSGTIRDSHVRVTFHDDKDEGPAGEAVAYLHELCHVLVELREVWRVVQVRMSILGVDGSQERA